MLIIKNEKGENIERMLKRYKRKFDRTKVLRQLRDKQQFTKPSVKRRKQLQKARYVEQKFGNQDNF
jgi:small subunit ribosomal protein S21